MKSRSLGLVFVLTLSLFMTACDFNGGVEQGRCVAFNPEAKTVTMVVDTTLDPKDPHYSGGVHTYKLPVNDMDMGPAPKPGGCLMLEIDKNMLLYYDPETSSVKEMPVEYINVEKGVGPKSPKLKGMTFPVIDKEKRDITVYSPRMEALVTFRVPENAINMPPYTWEIGDEVRIAFRKDDKNQAIRLMNVSKTSIFTR